MYFPMTYDLAGPVPLLQEQVVVSKLLRETPFWRLGGILLLAIAVLLFIYLWWRKWHDLRRRYRSYSTIIPELSQPISKPPDALPSLVVAILMFNRTKETISEFSGRENSSAVLRTIKETLAKRILYCQLVDLCRRDHLQIILRDENGHSFISPSNVSRRSVAYLSKRRPVDAPLDTLFVGWLQEGQMLNTINLRPVQDLLIKEAGQPLYQAGYLLWSVTYAHRLHRIKMLALLSLFLGAFSLLSSVIFCGILLLFIVLRINIVPLSYLAQSHLTPLGREMVLKWQAFATWICTVDPQLLRESPVLFETYLPYALALEVGEQWIEKAEHTDIPPPSWFIAIHHNDNIAIGATSLWEQLKVILGIVPPVRRRRLHHDLLC